MGKCYIIWKLSCITYILLLQFIVRQNSMIMTDKAIIITALTSMQLTPVGLMFTSNRKTNFVNIGKFSSTTPSNCPRQTCKLSSNKSNLTRVALKSLRKTSIPKLNHNKCMQITRTNRAMCNLDPLSARIISAWIEILLQGLPFDRMTKRDVIISDSTRFKFKY